MLNSFLLLHVYDNIYSWPWKGHSFGFSTLSILPSNIYIKAYVHIDSVRFPFLSRYPLFELLTLVLTNIKHHMLFLTNWGALNVC